MVPPFPQKVAARRLACLYPRRNHSAQGVSAREQYTTAGGGCQGIFQMFEVFPEPLGPLGPYFGLLLGDPHRMANLLGYSRLTPNSAAM